MAFGNKMAGEWPGVAIMITRKQSVVAREVMNTEAELETGNTNNVCHYLEAGEKGRD